MKFTRSSAPTNFLHVIIPPPAAPAARHVSDPKNGDMQRSAGESSQTLEF